MASMTLAIRIDVPLIDTNTDNFWPDVSVPDLHTFLKAYTSLETPN
jgi:hypothetical protein